MLLGVQGKLEIELDRSAARRDLLGGLLMLSRALFPDVRVTIIEGNPGFQAQASSIGGQKSIILLAGLAYHPALTGHGLSFALLHELGHLLGAGPRLTVTSALACECAADRWASREGKELFERHGAAFDIVCALDEIEQAVSGLFSETDLNSRNTCVDWTRRREAILSRQPGFLTECKLARVGRGGEAQHGHHYSESG